jgi:hypothetical protein
MRKILFGTTALLLSLVAAGGVFPQRALAQKGPPVSVDLKIDLNQAVNTISKTIGSNKDRGAWMKSMGEQLRAKYGAKYNVMVFNMQQDYDFNPGPPGTYKFIQTTFDGGLTGKINYGIWVFRSAAVFTNKGDGGFINWSFSGHTARDKGKVTFPAR